MKKLLVLSVLSLGLIGCTTIGQQITNTNGTVIIKGDSQLPGQSTKKIVNEPRATIMPVPAPKPPPPPCPPKAFCCPEIQYSYESVRVVDSYIVVW